MGWQKEENEEDDDKERGNTMLRRDRGWMRRRSIRKNKWDDGWKMMRWATREGERE